MNQEVDVRGLNQKSGKSLFKSRINNPYTANEQGQVNHRDFEVNGNVSSHGEEIRDEI